MLSKLSCDYSPFLNIFYIQFFIQILCPLKKLGYLVLNVKMKVIQSYLTLVTPWTITVQGIL